MRIDPESWPGMALAIAAAVQRADECGAVTIQAGIDSTGLARVHVMPRSGCGESMRDMLARFGGVWDMRGDGFRPHVFQDFPGGYFVAVPCRDVDECYRNEGRSIDWTTEGKTV